MLETKMLKRLKHVLPSCMFESIETSTTLGFPDIVYGTGSILGVAELKELSRAPKNKFTVPWRPGQLAWYKNYRNKYHIEAPYRLILTLCTEWYIIKDIKETYTMKEIEQCHVSNDKELLNHVVGLYNLLFNEQFSK